MTELERKNERDTSKASHSARRQREQTAKLDDSRRKEAGDTMLETKQVTLLDSSSFLGEQQSGSLLRLQQTHGNRYVQRLVEESKTAGDVFPSPGIQTEGVIARQAMPAGEAGAEVVGWVFSGLAGLGTWAQEEEAREAGEAAIPEIKRLLKEDPGLGVLVIYHFKQPDPSLYDPAVRGQIGWTFLSVELGLGSTREEAIAIFESKWSVTTEGYVFRNIYGWVPPLPVY